MFADGVAFRSGVLRISTVIARSARVQATELTESPVDRWTGMASVSVDTAGVGAAGMQMPFMPREKAAALRELIASRSSGTEFVW